MKATRESDIVTACLEYLKLRGIFCWRQNQGAIPLKNGGYRRFVGLKGVSDILGILADGRFLAVEVKKPGGKVRAEQQAFLDVIRENGGVALLVFSVNDLIEGLKQENHHG